MMVLYDIVELLYDDIQPITVQETEPIICVYRHKYSMEFGFEISRVEHATKQKA